MREKKELIQYTAVCALLLYLLCHYWDTAIQGLKTFLGVIHPLILGCAVAYILNLILSFYERTILNRWHTRSSVKRAASILLSFFTLFLMLFLIIHMIVPELRSCMDILLSNIPVACDMVMDFLNRNPDILALFPAVTNLQADIPALLQQFFS